MDILYIYKEWVIYEERIIYKEFFIYIYKECKKLSAN
jgi:hypothetical protein